MPHSHRHRRSHELYTYGIAARGVCKSCGSDGGGRCTRINNGPIKFLSTAPGTCEKSPLIGPHELFFLHTNMPLRDTISAAPLMLAAAPRCSLNNTHCKQSSPRLPSTPPEPGKKSTNNQTTKHTPKQPPHSCTENQASPARTREEKARRKYSIRLHDSTHTGCTAGSITLAAAAAESRLSLALSPQEGRPPVA